MSSKSASHRVFFAFALLAALVLASLPVHARPVHRSMASRNSVAASGDSSALSGIWHFVLSLWTRGTAKEGMSIDPNGGTNPAGTSTTPTGDLIDEGMSIDPDGGK